MKRILFFSLFICSVFSQSIWINEIHYDNYGTDEGEFVEIVADVTLDLSNGSITLYNVNNIVNTVDPNGIDISRSLKDTKNNLCENRLSKLLKILSYAA